jgi:hypothetical protein
MLTDLMRATEIQSATMLTAIRLIAADVTKPTINLGGAVRMVTERRHAIPNVALPRFVVSD